MADDAVPERTDFASVFVSALHPGVVPCGAAVGIGVVGPGQGRTLSAEVVGCDVFESGCEAVVHVGEEVVALVPAHLCDVNGESGGHLLVAGVASGLLHLSEPSIGAAGVVVDDGHEVAEKFGESPVVDLFRAVECGSLAEGADVVVLEEGDALVIHVYIVEEDAPAHHGQRVAQSPVRPVVAGSLSAGAGVLGVVPCAVAATQEVDDDGVPGVEDVLAEFFAVFGRPPFVVAHEFGGVGQLVAIDAAGK